MTERDFDTRKTFIGAIWPVGVVERDVIAELRELSRDDRVTATVRREAQEALRNWERSKGEEPKQ
jgi:hypothetical protein